MAPHTYKLTYFDWRGLAEHIRLLFAYGGIEYEDIRKKKEEWSELKHKQPFDQFPVLEVDGVILAQSRAIARFLAKEIGIAGSNNLEAAKCDMIMDAMMDTLTGFATFTNEEDKEKKKALETKYYSETVYPCLNNLEKILKESSGPYFLGDSISWADIGIAHYLTEIQVRNETPVLDDVPELKALVKNVFEIPQLKNWVEKRPKTQF